MRKSVLFVTVAMFAASLFSGVLTAGQERALEKDFARKEFINIKTVVGSCRVIKSEDEDIHLRVEQDFDPGIYKVEFKERKNKLIMRENLKRGTEISADAQWTIAVPEDVVIHFKSATGGVDVEGVGVEIDANTGTGNIHITDAGGEFDVNTGTGNVEIENSEGMFDASTGTGHVEVETTTIEGDSDFSSGTGDVRVRLHEAPEHDISLSSGTGKAELNCKKDFLIGYFEFKAMVDKGRIDCPVDFDGEEEFYEGESLYEIKYFTKEKDTPHISIATGTGKAVLKVK
jgi:hypothetical protein